MSDDEIVFLKTTKIKLTKHKNDVKEREIQNDSKNKSQTPNILIQVAKIKPAKKNIEPENEWQELFDKIEYKGDPLDNIVQENIHHLYHSLTEEKQKEWLEKTSGLGWSEKYIKIALTFWYDTGEYYNKDQEQVQEYLKSLSPQERSNFDDVCQIFCPENPYIHIKDSCGFIEYKQQKKDIKNYIEIMDEDDKCEFEKSIKKLSYPIFHANIIKTDEFKQYLKDIEYMNIFVSNNLLNKEETEIYGHLQADEKYHYLKEMDKFKQYLKDIEYMNIFVSNNLLNKEETEIYEHLQADKKYHYLKEMDKFIRWYNDELNKPKKR